MALLSDWWFIKIGGLGLVEHGLGAHLRRFVGEREGGRDRKIRKFASSADPIKHTEMGRRKKNKEIRNVIITHNNKKKGRKRGKGKEKRGKNRKKKKRKERKSEKGGNGGGGAARGRFIQSWRRRPC